MCEGAGGGWHKFQGGEVLRLINYGGVKELHYNKIIGIILKTIEIQF